jgi:hypothetical protein
MDVFEKSSQAAREGGRGCIDLVVMFRFTIPVWSL